MAKVQQTATKAEKTEHAHKEPKAKGPKLCVRDKWVRATDRMSARTEKLAKRLTSAPEIAALYQSAVATLCDASAQIAALSEDWRASSGRRGTGASNSATMVKGSVVDVRDAKKVELADLLDEGEMVGLVVEKIAGSRLKLRSTTGATLLLPRGFFTVAK